MRLKSVIAPMVIMAMATASPARACWNGDAIASARVSEFNTAMMVTTIGCSLIDVDIKASYEGFIVAYRKRLQGADDRLKRYFKGESGDGEKMYRHFYTQVGNRYGAAKTDTERCALFAAVAADLARANADDAMLDKYAAALVPDPAITGDRCAEMAAKP